MTTEKKVTADAEPKKTTPKPQNVSVQEKLGLPTVPYAVVGSTDTDWIDNSALVYKNVYSKKSLTVHHLQRRLTELGYDSAGAEMDGWYGDLVQLSMDQWRKDNDLEGEGVPSRAELLMIFKDDPNVSIV